MRAASPPEPAVAPAGAGLDAALGHYGLMKLTRFDASGPGPNCTPSAHLGIGLSLRAALRPA